MKTVIDIKSVEDHYEIYVEGKFYCSCDKNELSKTIQEIDENYKNND